MGDETHIDGERVRTRRLAKDWTQHDLAHHSTVDQSQISKIENGRLTDVALSTALRLARALDLTLDQLASGAPVAAELMDADATVMFKRFQSLTPEQQRQFWDYIASQAPDAHDAP